jgi:FAD binding domain-containing protein
LPGPRRSAPARSRRLHSFGRQSDSPARKPGRTGRRGCTIGNHLSSLLHTVVDAPCNGEELRAVTALPFTRSGHDRKSSVSTPSRNARLGRVIHDLYDIAIVGAGPAGSIAAYVAARRGFSVALIDRQTFPRDKACGDGIGPGAVRVVRRLGLEEVFDGYLAVGTITILGPNGSKSDSEVPAIDGEPATGFVIPRLQFDERLFQKAVKAGAEDLSGNRFLGMTLRDTDRLVELRSSAGTQRTIAARLVLGADGAYSLVRRSLVDRKDPKRSKHNGFAMRAYAHTSESWMASNQQPRLMLEFNRDLLPSYGWMLRSVRTTSILASVVLLTCCSVVA